MRVKNKNLEKRERAEVNSSARNQRLVDTICERISEGETLRKVCESLGLNYGNTWKLINGNEAWKSQYARARELQILAIADNLLHVARTPRPGIETTTKADGSIETKEGDMLGARKLEVDTTKWLLSKLIPRTYGDQPTTVVNTGSTHNILVMDEETIRKIQERRRLALEGRAKERLAKAVEVENPS